MKYIAHVMTGGEFVTIALIVMFITFYILSIVAEREETEDENDPLCDDTRV